jgi:hypothetical protein
VTLAISTGGASPALARKLRETLADHPALEWADLANVLARARREVKQRRVSIDPDRWQCCITQELLRLAQGDREDEALEILLAQLLDNMAPGLCPRLEACSRKGCSVSPKGKVPKGRVPEGLTKEKIS